MSLRPFYKFKAMLQELYIKTILIQYGLTTEIRVNKTLFGYYMFIGVTTILCYERLDTQISLNDLKLTCFTSGNR